LSGVYSELRSILDTKTSAQRVAKLAHDHFNEADFQRDNSTLRWLDVGCEDGTNTAVIHRYLKDRDYKVALTAIDTSQQREVDDVLEYSVFLNGGGWSFEDFCKSSPPSEKFDLITCLHGWYLIDPIYLLEAYRKLTHSGVLVVSLGPHNAGTHANGRPYRGNFINTLTSVVDGVLASARSDSTEKNYTEKVIRDDPYRNYAEDLAVAMRRFFGEPGDDAGFYMDVHEREVPAVAILNEKSLTDLGKAITIFFTHGIRVPIAEKVLFSRVHGALRPLVSSDGTLPATEVDFSIHRRQIAMRHRESIRFNARQRNAEQ
jgi:SAM-dependent methyltransferase